MALRAGRRRGPSRPDTTAPASSPPSRPSGTSSTSTPISTSSSPEAPFFPTGRFSLCPSSPPTRSPRSSAGSSSIASTSPSASPSASSTSSSAGATPAFACTTPCGRSLTIPSPPKPSPATSAALLSPTRNSPSTHAPGKSSIARSSIPDSPATSRNSGSLSTVASAGLARIPSHIPDPRTHLVRHYGAYANRTRRIAGFPNSTSAPPFPTTAETSPRVRARLPRQLGAPASQDLRNRPLLCHRCGATMRIVASLTDPRVIDRILAHLASRSLSSPRRPPPTPVA